jgi:hypothetical protein
MVTPDAPHSIAEIERGHQQKEHPVRKITHPSLAYMGIVKPYDELQDPDTLRNLDKPPMLIEDLLTESSVTGLTAMPGVGKSWLAFEIMRAVATGGKVMDQFQAQQGGVLFVGSDSSLHDYAYQWKRLTQQEWRDAMSATTEGATPLSPYIGCRWLIQSSFLLESASEVCRLIKTHESFSAGPLHEVWTHDTIAYSEPDEEGRAEMIRVPHYDMLAEFQGFKLIVFDTFSRLFRGNQNDAEATDKAMGHLKLIAEATGAAILVLHHNAKPSEFNDGSDWRGSSAMIGSLDAWLNLTAKKNDKYTLRGTWKKFRGITPANFNYRMEVSDPTSARLVYLDESGEKDDDDSLSQSILELIASHGPQSGREIRTALWPVYSDHWKDEAAFTRAVNNRTYGTKGCASVLEKIKPGQGLPFKFAIKQESDK